MIFLKPLFACFGIFFFFLSILVCKLFELSTNFSLFLFYYSLGVCVLMTLLTASYVEVI